MNVAPLFSWAFILKCAYIVSQTREQVKYLLGSVPINSDRTKQSTHCFMVKPMVKLMFLVQPGNQNSILWHYPIYNDTFKPLGIIGTGGISPPLDLGKEMPSGGSWVTNEATYKVSYHFKIFR
jgi:hypothetical protein